jgi:recombination protein RecA
MKLIEKRGSWFSFQETQIGQGREQTKQALDADPDLQARILAAVRERLAAGPVKLGSAPGGQAQAEDSAEGVAGEE